MITKINKIIPNHQLILADFDCFLTSTNYRGLKGMNQPVVTNKLEDPTKWQEYDTYLIPRGDADICFPTDFLYLQHAYKEITGKPASIYKNPDFMEMFSLRAWCETRNNYNPMREEYVNTSFLVTEYNRGEIDYSTQ